MEDDVFTQIRNVLEDIESDAGLKGVREWDLVKDRYQENVDHLKELVESL